jgi:hypothetical protein
VCTFLIVYICIDVPDPIRGEGWNPINGLTSPHFCACSKPGPGFPTSDVVGFFCMFNDLRREVIVRFGDVIGIVDQHCLSFLFIY